jgi:hypothetical protein
MTNFLTLHYVEQVYYLHEINNAQYKQTINYTHGVDIFAIINQNDCYCNCDYKSLSYCCDCD